MIISLTCPKCNSSTIAGPHRVHADRSHSKVDLPGLSTATLESYSCVDCGYTEFYVDQMGRQNMINSGRFLSHRRVEPEVKVIQEDYCSTCGALVTGNTLFCDNCGSKLE